MSNLGMSYTEIRGLPITYRRWYIDKVVEDIKSKAEAQKKAMSKDRVQEVPMGEMVTQMNNASDFSSPKKF